MMKKNFTVLGIVGALVVAALIGAAPARAQEQTHYTYVSFWAVPRAQWNDFEKAQAQTYSVLERLVTDGTLVEWGSGAALVHAEDGYTHSDWFVSTSQAGITKTLESLQNSSRTQAFVNATKHMDLFLHTLAHGGKTARTTSGYLRVAFWQAKPDRGDAVEQFFKKYIQPDLDAGVADGSVLMYNFDAEQIHTDAPGGYDLAVVYAGEDGLDKTAATLAGHAKENPAAGEGFAAMLESNAHRNTLSRILAFQHK